MENKTEYEQLRAAGLTDQEIGMLRNTGATHSAILLYAAGKRGKIRANANRRTRHQAMKDLGLTRVRGAMGGVYYE